jgi:hypothetical protein
MTYRHRGGAITLEMCRAWAALSLPVPIYVDSWVDNMARAKLLVADEFRDSDGYWITLKRGWKNGQDPVGTLHQIHEDTKREAYSWLSSALPCDCAECVEGEGQ